MDVAATTFRREDDSRSELEPGWSWPKKGNWERPNSFRKTSGTMMRMESTQTVAGSDGPQTRINGVTSKGEKERPPLCSSTVSSEVGRTHVECASASLSLSLFVNDGDVELLQAKHLPP